MDLKITDLSTASASIRMDIACFSEKVADLDQRLTNIEDHVGMLSEHDVELRTLREKLTDLEDKSRRDNVCFFGIPERKEGTNIKSFLQSLLPELTGLTFSLPLEFQRVNRVGPPRSIYSGRPRPISACFLQHEQAQQVLLTPRTQGPFLLEDQEDRVAVDFSRIMNEKRKTFLALWPQLRKLDIKFGLFEPPLGPGGHVLRAATLFCHDLLIKDGPTCSITSIRWVLAILRYPGLSSFGLFDP
ncbi:hypothetical protein NDU88_004857 [Pleurodeles waltl]|uniref:Uncharacterized protein n=1 Tax=Pleurodeles waltl TaxID=8319 RepID=A0AAV7W661_PLEWA|nr:hypothetical protein NDU88_004857 [Pleurodeles waltl]